MKSQIYHHSAIYIISFQPFLRVSYMQLRFLFSLVDWELGILGYLSLSPGFSCANIIQGVYAFNHRWLWILGVISSEYMNKSQGVEFVNLDNPEDIPPAMRKGFEEINVVSASIASRRDNPYFQSIIGPSSLLNNSLDFVACSKIAGSSLLITLHYFFTK